MKTAMKTPPKTAMKTAVIYARYSSDSQTEQSIEGQLRVCKDYAERNNIVIVDTYIDRAMTGRNDRRSDFQRMLKDSNKKAWDIVLVYKLDRFSRNKYEMAMHKRTLRDNGIKLVSAMENIPDTPEGIILESLLEGMAEYYSAELSQKVKRGMNETRHKGNFTGGYVLFGYKVENHKVVINEDEAEVVRWMFNECASGTYVVNIIEKLREKGIMCRGKPFARNTVYHMLANEKYNGIYRHNDEVFTNIYPQIISDELFNIVKTTIENNRYGKHKPDVCYLLKNKVKCGYCGERVVSSAGTSRNGSVIRYYKCSKEGANKSCILTPIRKEVLEKIVMETIMETINSPTNLKMLEDKIFELFTARQQENNTLNLLMSEYKKTENAISNILNCLEQGITTEATKERLNALENKRYLLNEQILALKAQARLQLTKEDVHERIISAVRKKPLQMINILVKGIRLKNEVIEIDFKYTDKKGPNDNRWDFCYYDTIKNFIVDTHTFKSRPIKRTINVKFFI